jgi:hypothetical protein
MVNSAHVDVTSPQFYLPPAATALAETIGPAMTVTMTIDDIGAANGRAYDAADNRARRTGNYGTGTGANGHAFKRTGLGRERKSRQRQHEQSGLDERAHNNLLG